jgi:molecular chaperone DnaJ
MRGKGIPALRGGARGDQHVVIHVDVPKSLNRDQKEKLEAFAESLTQQSHPRLASFLDRVKDLFSSDDD